MDRALDVLEERFVLVVSARCAACERVYPLPPEGEPQNYGELLADVDKEWIRRGAGNLRWKTWPKRYPMWLVRQGFRCPICLAPNMLLSLEPDRDSAPA